MQQIEKENELSKSASMNVDVIAHNLLPELFDRIRNLAHRDILAGNSANFSDQSRAIFEELSIDALIEAELFARVGIDACDRVPGIVARRPWQL